MGPSHFSWCLIQSHEESREIIMKSIVAICTAAPQLGPNETNFGGWPSLGFYKGPVEFGANWR